MKQYTIVYAEDGGDYLRQCAEDLQQAIAKSCGTMPEVVGDGTPAQTNEILLGNTNRPETVAFCAQRRFALLEYCMGMQDGKYVIAGSGLLPIGLAVRRYIWEYLSGSSKQPVPQTGEILAQNYFSGAVARPEGTDLRVMTLNMMAEYHAVKSYGERGYLPNDVRFEVLEALLAAYGPDVIGMQECSPLWRTVLAQRLDPAKWGIVDPGKVDGSNGETILVYNRQTVAFEDGGHLSYPEFAQTSRICAGRFRLNDGRRFLAYTTHWSWNRPEVADMEMRFYADTVVRMRAENRNIPAFCTADYNTQWHSDRYLAFCQRSGEVDSFDLAKASGTTVNELQAFGRPGDEGRGWEDYTKTIDHIFCPPETTVHRYETVMNNRMIDLSDHAPRYADVSW